MAPHKPIVGLVLAALVAVASGLNVSPRSKFVVKSSIESLPSGWKRHSAPPRDAQLSLRIALTQPNFSTLEAELFEVSDPSSSRWTEHLSKEDVEALIAPDPTSITLLDDYLKSYGIDLGTVQRTPANDWITVTVSVAQAEELLDTEYSIFEHSPTGKKALRTTKYSLPEYLHGHIDVIQPTDYFGRVSAQATNYFVDGLSASVIDPGYNVTLADLKSLYNIGNYKPSGKHGSKLAVAGYLEQYANLADLRAWYAKYLPQAVNTTLKIESINGGENSQNASLAGVEAALDVQYAGGLSYPIPNIYYTTAGRGANTQPNISYEDNGNEPYDIFLLALLAKKDSDLPQTISTSYGEGEGEVPLNYARRVCSLFAQLGARGISSLHASGDGGVGNGDATVACSTPNRFGALFPASCPYLTSVGATYEVPEQAVAFSGGGLSDYFVRPAYQALTVPKYIKQLGNTYKGLYNASGRGIPDVAAQGLHLQVVVAGQLVRVSGTSASTPVFSGIVALLNDALIAKGRRPLGFLNPWLYTIGQFGLNDITLGSNPGCGTTGYNATKGWDPVTGLGTPDFAKLKKLLLV